MVGDTIADDDERLDGEALLVPVVREGQIVHREPLERVRDRAVAQLGALPAALRLPWPGARPDPYPVALSPRLAERARLSHGGR
jgi:hypothetical protein